MYGGLARPGAISRASVQASMILHIGPAHQTAPHAVAAAAGSRRRPAPPPAFAPLHLRNQNFRPILYQTPGPLASVPFPTPRILASVPFPNPRMLTPKHVTVRCACSCRMSDELDRVA